MGAGGFGVPRRTRRTRHPHLYMSVELVAFRQCTAT
ncbi:hypothetical protein GA0115253_1027959 [Streptomyces sp. Termitarium-T10T-6]|nr:hypothetical protein GA0115253_1027959 [Streptomyces sp. Termitarium-T10T-6]